MQQPETRSALGAYVTAHPKIAALVIFLFVCAVYAINPDPIWSGDLNSNSIYAFNILTFGTIYLENFKGGYLDIGFNGLSFRGAAPGTWAEGRLTLSYPVGTAVVTFPLYVIFFIYFKIVAPTVSITSAAFEPYRLLFSHLAATAVSAATVALFFLISRRRFSLKTALITTGCLAFATMQWGLLSQTLLQHGPSSFVVMASAYLLLRADDDGQRNLGYLAAAGALAGLLFLIRPTNLAFMAALLTFSILRYRTRSLAFCLGFAGNVRFIDCMEHCFLWLVRWFCNLSGPQL